MKLISWNVNGLRACIGKGFLDFVNFIDADVICLQETKLQPHQIELDLPQYHIYWNSADKKGYSGTAVLARTSTATRGASSRVNIRTSISSAATRRTRRTSCAAFRTASNGRMRCGNTSASSTRSSPSCTAGT